MSLMVGLQRSENKKQTQKPGVVDGHQKISEELSKLRWAESKTFEMPLK